VNELLQAAGPGATLYLVGAGGCGMSALGHLLLDLGYRVAGSDLASNADVQSLQYRGAAIHTGHAAAQLQSARPQLVVYSSAIRLDNPELVAARQMEIPIVRRAILLAALVHRQRGICVAGMHGKTTTTAWLAYALEQLQAQPSYAIGAQVPQLPRPARCREKISPARGTTDSTFETHPAETTQRLPWFVAEADESDGTLRQFRPEHAIILNLDEEHLDFYANFEAICDEFQNFAAQTSGLVFYSADDPALVGLFAGRELAISFGFNPLAIYRIEQVSLKWPGPISNTGAANARVVDYGRVRNEADAAANPGCRFEIWKGNEKIGDFTARLLGEKNISNAAAVIAVLHQLGYSPAAIARAMAGFRGAARRQQELFRDEHFRVFDDYAHHPNEIAATIRALRQLGSRRLLVAFQPHRYTRTQHLLGEFATCFKEADRLWITEIYAASEKAIPGVNGAALAEAVRAQGQPVDFVPALGELRAALRQAMEPGDLVLFLGAGDITHLAHTLALDLSDEVKHSLFKKLAAQLSPESLLRRDEPLAKRTTLRVGGPADFYVEPASENDLTLVLQFCAAHQLPFMVLGRGSNLLVRDGGIRGMVICLAHAVFSAIRVNGEQLICGAGARLKNIAQISRREGLAGLEFLEGIPGSVGGALRMNAGAMGGAMFDVVETIRIMDPAGNILEQSASELLVQYRSCPVFKTHIALGAVLRGVPSPREEIVSRMQTYSQKRWESQPAAPSAGCIFKNPETIPAGKLIDELGLKGTRVGGASISDKHGNFIVNEGGATAQDILRLIAMVKERARKERGIELETEVQIVGEDLSTGGDAHPNAGGDRGSGTKTRKRTRAD
jgi:UDP-N-acetylmuramate--alanine ligase